MFVLLCYQSGSSWLEVLDPVQLLVTMMCCLWKQAVQCWQPRESFHLPFGTFPVAYQTRYNFLLTSWGKEDTVALSTSKTDFSFFISLLIVDLGLLLQIIKKVVRSLVSTASSFSY